MSRFRVLLRALVAGGLVASVSGCGLLAPPSMADVAGEYAADGATVVLREDGTCYVENFPEYVMGTSEAPAFGEERVTGECTWSLGRLLYSGSRELDVVGPVGFPQLFLEYLKPLGQEGRLIRTIGDPDGADRWELCRTDS